MKTTMCTKGGAPRAGTMWVLAWLFLAILGLNAGAAGGGSSSGGSPTNPTGMTPDEEGNSLPVVADSHGLTFVGPLRELRALALSIHGEGRIDIKRLGRGTLAVTLVGDYMVELDRARLALSSVDVLFVGGRAFGDGVAFLQVGSSSPVALDAERVPLPVTRMASSRRAQGNLLNLDVLARGRSAHVTATFATDRVTLTQRIQ